MPEVSVEDALRLVADAVVADRAWTRTLAQRMESLDERLSEAVQQANKVGAIVVNHEDRLVALERVVSDSAAVPSSLPYTQEWWESLPEKIAGVVVEQPVTDQSVDLNHQIDTLKERVWALEAVVRLCEETLRQHETWCGFNKDAPGNTIHSRCVRRIQTVLG